MPPLFQEPSHPLASTLIACTTLTPWAKKMRKRGVDHTYAINRRLGLPKLPMVCVFAVVVLTALDTPAHRAAFAAASPTALVAGGAMAAGAFVGLKFCTGCVLLAWADRGTECAERTSAKSQKGGGVEEKKNKIL